MLSGLPQAAEAQEREWTFDGQGGIAIPIGELSDLTNVGPAAGVGAAFWFNPRVAVRVDGAVDILNGRTLSNGPSPDMRLWHYNAGVEFQLAEPRGPWDVTLNVGGGGTTFDSDDFIVNGLPTDFTLNGGAQVGYDLSPSVNVFVDGRLHLIFVTEEDTQNFASLGTEVDTFSEAWNLPMTAGLRIRI